MLSAGFIHGSAYFGYFQLRFPELLAPLGVPAAVVARHGT
jgi:hypothetical protein